MAATRGPVPKRSSQRRRENKTEEIDTAPGAERVNVPAASRAWHSAAKAWYESLAKSGQSSFYEPSDWQVAWLIAESISRDLKPQVVGISEVTGKAVRATIPMKGASLAAYLRAMSALLVTEGDRRRMRVELLRDSGKPADEPTVASMDEYRRRIAG